MGMRPDKGSKSETRTLNKIRQGHSLYFSTIKDEITAIALMQLAYRAGKQSPDPARITTRDV